MKKRFTDVDKWEQPWFRSLPPPTKIIWIFLLDRCDPAGVWEVDQDAFCFHTGCSAKSFKEGMDALRSLGRISSLALAGERKIWITKFVLFQHGILSPQCKPHNPVFASLEKHGLKQMEDGRIIPSAKGSPKGMDTLEVKVKGKGKVKGVAEEDPVIGLPVWCVKWWNDALSGLCPKITKLTASRKTAIVRRLKEHSKADSCTDMEAWKGVVALIKDSAFLTGKTCDFKASIDWVLLPRIWTKIWEGNYVNKDQPKSLTDDDHGKGF